MFALVVSAAAFVCIGAAQESVRYGSVGGRVTDTSGGVVAGARVVAVHGGTNVAAETSTDRYGRFRFPYLKVGEYAVIVRHRGFAGATRRVALTAGSAFELPVELVVEGTAENIVVTADPAVLETARTQIAGSVPLTELRALPLNGRSYLDLALLAPGVSPANTGSTQLFAETSAVPGQGLSVGSQRNFSNNFAVDGLSANDDAAGLSGGFLSLETVEELQVVTSGARAGFGRALGGSVSVVTRSGTNALHADLYSYFRNQRFDAANPLSHSKLPVTQAQYGASAGGPVVRERTFYFGNFEQRVLNQSGLVTISPENVAAINSRLDQSGYKGARIATGIYANPVHSTMAFGKLDHQFGSRDQAGARYSLYEVHGENSRGAGALNAVTASAGLDNRDQTIAASNIATISARTVNETRAQVVFSALEAPPSDPVGPAVSIAGVAAFGRLSSSPVERRNRLYQVADSLSHQSGGHALRVGADFLFNNLTIAFPRTVRGSYTFASLPDFLSGRYGNSAFTQTFGDSVIALHNPNAGVYAEDEWKAAPGLTFSAGVRYDVQWLATVRTDRNNLSPRAGFAWTPSERTVVRGGFGLYYDRVPLRPLANALLSAGNTTDVSKLRQIGVSLSPAQAGAPVFPDVLAVAPPPLTPVNLTTMDPHMENAYSTQGSVEVERQVGTRRTLGAGYEHVRGVHLMANINQNVPACAAAGGNNGCRPNPAYANNSQYSPAADSRYDALHVSFLERPGRRGHYRVSYTWSKALNNVGENFFSAPLDARNIWLDWGRSDNDQRHRVVVDGALRWGGFEWSGLMQYYSALPLNITSGVTTIQGTTGRPVVNGAFIGRNTGEGNDFWSLGARLSRRLTLRDRLRIDSIVEAFNVLNRRNNLIRNGNFGPGAYPSNPSPTFGQVTAVNDPRVLQLGLRIGF